MPYPFLPYPILAEQQTWYKGTTPKANITQIDITTSYTPTGSPTESWNADTGNTGSIMCYVEGTKLTIAGDGSECIKLSANAAKTFQLFESATAINGAIILNTSDVTTFEKFFERCYALETVDTSGFDTQNSTSLKCMFQGCFALKTTDVSGWNTINVTDMTSVFNKCYALETVNVGNWNTSKVESMKAMFSDTWALTTVDVSNWDVSKVTNFYGMFNTYNPDSNGTLIPSALSTLDVSKWDTSSATNMATMFQCTSLQTLDVSNWDVDNVTDMTYMFNHCSLLTSLDVSNWDTTSVTNMSYMFYGCFALQTLDVSNWDTSNVTDMRYMFKRCIDLQSLDVTNWNVSNVTNMKGMFGGDNYGATKMKLTELDVSKWNTGNVTDMSFMFYGANGLDNIDVSNWNVKKVKNFDHIFAHSHITLSNDNVSKWVTSAATNMYAMLYSLKNTVLDVSNFDTSNVTVFGQMFEQCSNLEQILGLENFDTSNGIDFCEMFLYCSKLKSLNLSSFDTRKAKDNVTVSTNGGKSRTLYDIFKGCHSLEQITLGENFSFNGDGTTTNNIGVLPTPSSTYVEYANGKWYLEDGTSYSVTEIPNQTAGTYYASLDIIPKKYSIKFGTLKRIANAVREKTATTDEIPTKNIPDTILTIRSGTDTSDATATASELFLNKTAYVNGEKITGEFTIDSELSEQDGLLEQIENALANKTAGNAGDYNAGYAAGKQAEYDAFWDAYQQNGARTEYQYAFAYYWYDSIFKPKHPLVVTNGQGMFMYSEITEVPELDLTNCTSTNSMFYKSKVVTIDKLKISETTPIHTAMFNFCYYLANLTIEGTIAQNINLNSANLEHDSIISVINALKNYSGSGTTYTCTLGTKNLPKLTDAEKAIATQKGWTLA